MGDIWHIGDTHFNHKGVFRFRKQFSDVYENNNTLVENILKTVKKKDVLWLHGDICFNRESIEYIEYMNQYIYNIRFILGNHDFQGLSITERMNCLMELSQYVSGIHGFTKHKGMWFSHAPLHENELFGNINIHGHVHENTIPDDRYVNVSADNTGFYPVKLTDIKNGWRRYES